MKIRKDVSGADTDVPSRVTCRLRLTISSVFGHHWAAPPRPPATARAPSRALLARFTLSSAKALPGLAGRPEIFGRVDVPQEDGIELDDADSKPRERVPQRELTGGQAPLEDRQGCAAVGPPER